jgi:hypothetical protein
MMSDPVTADGLAKASDAASAASYAIVDMRGSADQHVNQVVPLRRRTTEGAIERAKRA